MADILLEVCVDNVAGLEAAIKGGADRIELCSALAVGGLTPSAGLMSAAQRSPIPCYAMIRPRAGDFIYSNAELDIMTNDIYFAASSGLAGVVFGVSLPDGRLDSEALIALSNAIDDMPRTLHRAFDLVPDMADAIELAIECGFERILSSGRAVNALDGIDDLVSAVKIAGDRISIMPGAGVNLDTIDAIVSKTKAREVHSSCSSTVPVSDLHLVTLGFSESTAKQTDIDIVRAMKSRLVGRR